MSGYNLVTTPIDVTYRYDGSRDGFLCCVHTSVYQRELPTNIASIAPEQLSLLADKWIDTNPEQAQAVLTSIEKNIGKPMVSLLSHIMLCHHPDKEIKLLKLILAAFRHGGSLLGQLGNPVVADVLAMEKHLLGERHLLTGFARFKDYGDILGAVISPKNFVLPLLGGHFRSRFPNENWMIYDDVHRAVLIYQDKQLQLTMVEELHFDDETETELHYQALWKQFYHTIGIKERLNPRCRMSMMPKRYWVNMTEVQDLVT